MLKRADLAPPTSSAMAAKIFHRYPSEMPILSRSASVKCSSTETSMPLPVKAGEYRSKQMFASHFAIGCAAAIPVDGSNRQSDILVG